MSKEEELFLIPLENVVVFPNCNTVLVVNNKEEIGTVDEALKNDSRVFCVSVKNKNSKVINKENLYNIGVICEITQKVVVSESEIRIFIRCIDKATLNSIHKDQENSVYRCLVTKLRKSRIKEDAEEISNIKKIALQKLEMFIKNNKRIPKELAPFTKFLDNESDVVFICANILNLSVEKKQEILEERTLLRQLEIICEEIETEIKLQETEKEIDDKIDKKLQDRQKQFYLKEKLRAIKNELKSDDDEDEEDINEDVNLIRKKAKGIKFPKDVKETFYRELKKLSSTPSYSPEYSTIKNYIEWLIDIPWNKNSAIKNDIKKAEEILDRDHYGLEEVKERILEFIAVYSKTKSLNGPIICLAGPPGVGKTSLTKSIAEALNRNYVKVSLGGVRDEAEIRGHRKTYVGAMPGKIIQSMKKAGTSNPLMLLDEIDKMSSDLSRGDPASALLEVLDPEQNKSFDDHFLETGYDLSNVMFIATANDLGSIPMPLRDRMEIIKISGYTEDEKLEITKRYIIPKLLKSHGLKESEFSIDDETIIQIIRRYTFEAGVRNLERNIEKLLRKITKKIVEDNKIKSISININNLKDYLGIEIFDYNKAGQEPKLGISNGLAYTEFGGDILYIEALKFDGSGKLVITGKLGDVMKESVEAGFSYVRSKASDFGISSEQFNKYDFHLHVPEGATPKDGPSAGIAISSALMSVLTGMKIRSDIAMTGEITLSGRVLPIGGLKEKLLGALRGGIKKAIIPYDNIKDLEKVPAKVKDNMEILPVKTIEEAFKILLVDYEIKKVKSN